MLALELPDGRHRRTVIVGFALPGGERHHLVRKRTAQFEPELANGRSLHYTTAICVDDCGGTIWELLDFSETGELGLMVDEAKVATESNMPAT